MSKQGVNEGQMKAGGGPDKFANPSEAVSAPITGLAGGGQNLGEKTGFQTTGYIDKKGTPYGEAAKLNLMPPGMEIENQDIAEINAMPMKTVTSESYPGDGW